MPTFSVTQQPTQLYPGWQNTTTLTNLGPSKIYLDNTASVSSVNSFPLYPMDTMTWQPRTELWAVAESSVAALSANPAGNLSIANAERQVLIYRAQQATLDLGYLSSDVAPLDTSAYQTIKLTIQIPTTIIDPTVFKLDLRWWASWEDYDAPDASFYLSQTETYRFWGVGGAVTVTIPVQGAYLSLYASSIDILTGTPLTWRIYGTTRSLDYDVRNYAFNICKIPNGAGTYQNPVIYSRTSFAFTGVLLLANGNLTSNGDIIIPDIGDTFDIQVNTPGSLTNTNARIVMRSLQEQIPFSVTAPTIVSTSTNNAIATGIRLPRGLPMGLQIVGLVPNSGANTTANIAFQYH